MTSRPLIGPAYPQFPVQALVGIGQPNDAVGIGYGSGSISDAFTTLNSAVQFWCALRYRAGAAGTDPVAGVGGDGTRIRLYICCAMPGYRKLLTIHASLSHLTQPM
jgi:hypothetical protein